MRLPDLLPERLTFLQEVDSEKGLLKKLQPQATVLVDFFEHALEDEMWCERHHTFITQAIELLTKEFFQERIASHIVLPAVLAMQRHFSSLKRFFPFHLIIEVNGESFPMNSLMVAVCSETLYHEIRHITSLGEGKISLKLNHFPLFKEFIETAHVDTLWRYSEGELMMLHTESASIGLVGFMDLTADVLKRYLTKENVMEYLILAQEELWSVLRDHCIDTVNALPLDVRFEKTPIEALSFKFEVFSDKAYAIFSRIKELITHLQISHSEDPLFEEVVTSCPHLEHLDLSQSISLNALPKGLISLDLSMCPWLTEDTLERVAKTCKKLRALYLQSNGQLGFITWSKLSQLQRLEELHLSRCHQIGDEELSLIARSVPKLQRIHLGECSLITDEGFMAAARLLPRLFAVDISRTNLGDLAIIELADQAKDLEELDLTRCQKITERGVREVLQIARHLQKLVLVQCPFSREFISEIREGYPRIMVGF